MARILMYAPHSETTPPLIAFLSSLDSKLQRKLDQQIRHLAVTPVSALTEPYYKHFAISKYSRLFELREKSQIMVRIIFAFGDNASIYLLEPFIKKQKRLTMHALETSLKMLEQIESNPQLVLEYGNAKVLKKEGNIF